MQVVLNCSKESEMQNVSFSSWNVSGFWDFPTFFRVNKMILLRKTILGVWWPLYKNNIRILMIWKYRRRNNAREDKGGFKTEILRSFEWWKASYCVPLVDRTLKECLTGDEGNLVPQQKVINAIALVHTTALQITRNRKNIAHLL